VAVYDANRFDETAIRRMALGEAGVPNEGLSWLHQEVV
jgi:hypothetical protein